MNLSRRKFLSYLLLSAPPVSLMPRWVFGNADSGSAYENDWLSFSTQEGIGPWMDEDTLLERYIPLHVETALPFSRIEQSEQRGAIRLLQEVLAAQGVTWQKSYRVEWTYQHYGVYGSSVHSNRLLSYSKLAQDYLYSHVSGLAEINLDWRLLGKNDADFLVEPRRYKGLVGKYTYLVYRVNAVDEEGEQILPGIVNITPVERAINYIVDDDEYHPTSSTIFVIPGLTSLVSPFSELIHLSTHQPTLEFTEVLKKSVEEADWQRVGRIYGESITEAAGIFTALNFIQQYGHDTEEDIVRTVLDNTSNRFPLVNNALAYMNRKGVQQVLAAYADNPSRLLKTISNG